MMPEICKSKLKVCFTHKFMCFIILGDSKQLLKSTSITHSNPILSENSLLQGSTLLQGTVNKAIVLRTGDKTVLGRTSHTLYLGQKLRFGNFLEEIRHFSHSIIAIVLFPGFLVLFIIVLMKYPLELIFKFIVGHALGCIPTSSLFLLAISLVWIRRTLKSKAGVTLKNIFAFDSVASMTAIVIDKDEILAYSSCFISHLYYDRNEFNVKSGGAAVIAPDKRNHVYRQLREIALLCSSLPISKFKKGNLIFNTNPLIENGND